MRFKLTIAILLFIICFSCKDKERIDEVVGHIYTVQSPWYGSMASAFVLYRPEKPEVYYKEYFFDEIYEKPDLSKYYDKIVRVRGQITNGYLGYTYLTYIRNPQIIEVKDIDIYKISQEDYTNPDSYIWK